MPGSWVDSLVRYVSGEKSRKDRKKVKRKRDREKDNRRKE